MRADGAAKEVFRLVYWLVTGRGNGKGGGKKGILFVHFLALEHYRNDLILLLKVYMPPSPFSPLSVCLSFLFCCLGWRKREI